MSNTSSFGRLGNGDEQQVRCLQIQRSLSVSDVVASMSSVREVLTDLLDSGLCFFLPNRRLKLINFENTAGVGTSASVMEYLCLSINLMRRVVKQSQDKLVSSRLLSQDLGT